MAHTKQDLINILKKYKKLHCKAISGLKKNELEKLVVKLKLKSELPKAKTKTKSKTKPKIRAKTKAGLKRFVNKVSENIAEEIGVPVEEVKKEVQKEFYVPEKPILMEFPVFESPFKNDKISETKNKIMNLENKLMEPNLTKSQKKRITKSIKASKAYLTRLRNETKGSGMCGGRRKRRGRAKKIGNKSTFNQKILFKMVENNDLKSLNRYGINTLGELDKVLPIDVDEYIRQHNEIADEYGNRRISRRTFLAEEMGHGTVLQDLSNEYVQQYDDFDRKYNMRQYGGCNNPKSPNCPKNILKRMINNIVL
jgi:hypothetical protein